MVTPRGRQGPEDWIVVNRLELHSIMGLSFKKPSRYRVSFAFEDFGLYAFNRFFKNARPFWMSSYFIINNRTLLNPTDIDDFMVVEVPI